MWPSSFRVHTLDLNKGCFFCLNRHGDMSLTYGTLKPPPISAALKPGVYCRTALGAIRISVPVAVVVFSDELSF
jgi:hypothetical protein